MKSVKLDALVFVYLTFVSFVTFVKINYLIIITDYRVTIRLCSLNNIEWSNTCLVHWMGIYWHITLTCRCWWQWRWMEDIMEQTNANHFYCSLVINIVFIKQGPKIEFWCRRLMLNTIMSITLVYTSLYCSTSIIKYIYLYIVM